MIPLRDRNPTATVPIVNFILIGLNLAAFAYELSLGDEIEALFMTYGVIPRDVVYALSGTPVDPRPLVTLFSSMFLQAGGCTSSETCCTSGFLGIMSKTVWDPCVTFSFT